jgi:hypothetical protein
VNLIAKARFASALAGFALLAATAQPAAAAGFSGTWSVSGTMTTATSIARVSPVCTLRQSGDALSGTCRGPNGVGTATGEVNGARVLFQWHAVRTNSIGMSGVATFHGTLGGDGVIRGTWTFTGFPAAGTFTAIRA